MVGTEDARSSRRRSDGDAAPRSSCIARIVHSAALAIPRDPGTQRAREARTGTVPAMHAIDGLSSDARTSFGGKSMNLFVWLPAMFLLGLGSMGLFVAFVTACDRI